MSAASSLQRAIFEALSADAALAAITGPDGITDRLVRGRDEPVVRIAGIESRDHSTGTEKGEEHLVRLDCRSGEGGHRTVEDMAARLRAVLDDAPLLLEGYALVNMRHRTTKVRREAAAKGHVAELVFRAVTES